MSEPGGEDIDGLITRHLEGDLDQAGLGQLEAWLIADPAHRRSFLAAVQVHQGLRGRVGVRQEEQRRRPRLRRPQARRIGQILAGAVLAAALVALAVLWWGPAPPAPASPSGPLPTSPAIALRGGPCLMAWTAAWCGHEGAWSPASAGPLSAGACLRTGTGGSARVAFADGTTVQLGADTVLAVPTEAGPAAVALRLDRGSCEAEVAHQPSGSPLRLATPRALVTVVGTHLRITTADEETMVAVSRGQVVLERLLDHAHITIDAGEEAVVAPEGAPLKHREGTPWGRLLAAGPGTAHPTLASLGELAPGDVVEIGAGTYAEACRWHSSGTELRPIVLRAAAGPRPWLDGAGLDLSGVGAASRALFQIEGGHYRIEGLGFRNARNHANAAGIRLVEAPDVAIARCRIEDCDNGLDGEGDGVTVDDCQITACGTPENDGYCHDCYIDGGSSLEITRSSIDHALFGQDLKCGGHRILIEGNRIGEAQDGEISILDEPSGAEGDSIRLLGNLVKSTLDRHGNHQRFIALASEHGGRRRGSMLVAYNTLVAADGRNLLLDLDGSGLALAVCDNLLCGTRRILEGGGGSTGCGNWAPLGAATPPSWHDIDDSTGPPLVDLDDWRPATGDGTLAGKAVPAGSIPGFPVDAQPRWEPPRSAGADWSPRSAWADPGAFVAGPAAVQPVPVPAPAP